MRALPREQRPIHVAIIGGGPGGLLLAQGLRKDGVSVALYERDHARTDYLQGYRLRVRTRAVEALRACLPPQLLALFLATCGRSPTVNLLLDQDLVPLPAGPSSAGREDVQYERSVSRITLRQILLEGLEGVVQHGRSFERYEERPDGRLVAHFSEGPPAEADILVGADGAGSSVRGQLLPHAEVLRRAILRAHRGETGVVEALRGYEAVMLESGF